MARRREDIVIHRRRNSRHHRNKSRNYVDHNGYKRGKPKHSDLIHRQIAYKQIYLKNKKDYPLSFSEYQVHHIDENKKNNHVSNLQIVTSNEHKKIHGIGKYGIEKRLNFALFWVIVIPIYLGIGIGSIFAGKIIGGNPNSISFGQIWLIGGFVLFASIKMKTNNRDIKHVRVAKKAIKFSAIASLVYIIIIPPFSPINVSSYIGLYIITFIIFFISSFIVYWFKKNNRTTKINKKWLKKNTEKIILVIIALIIVYVIIMSNGKNNVLPNEVNDLSAHEMDIKINCDDSKGDVLKILGNPNQKSNNQHTYHGNDDQDLIIYYNNNKVVKRTITNGVLFVIGDCDPSNNLANPNYNK